MDRLIHWLIVSAFAAPTTDIPAAAASLTDRRHPDAVEVFHCDFSVRRDTDVSWDVNYDGWPDKWTRLYGPELPHYVSAQIEDDLTTDSTKCLTIRMNGGGAHVVSPAVAVSPKFSYKLEALLRVEGVRHARARLLIEFCDEQRQVIQTEATPWFRNTLEWEKAEIGPISPTDDRIELARLVLLVEPGASADLAGAVSLGDVWLGRLPKMVVTTNSPFNVYEDPHGVEVTCELSGILEKNPDILFELLDASSRRIDNDSIRLDGRLITERLSRASDIVDARYPQRAGYAGVTVWRPPIEEHGHYHVRVTMQSSAGMLDSKLVSIVVAPPLERPPGGEFGWSLAGKEAPIDQDALRMLLTRAAVNWVKLPVWYGPTEEGRGDRLAALAEQLAANDIEMVGVLDKAPPDSELAQRLGPDASIADALSADVHLWQPLLDDVLTRLALRVRWWQLGSDRDVSLSAAPQAASELEGLRAKLFRFGQDVHLGMGWDWTNAAGYFGRAAGDFQQFSASPPLTGAEMAKYLELAPQAGVARWVLVEPLSRRQYDLETRARDLVEQMLAAKMGRADAIFAAQPFDDERGLMQEDGAPADLFLPWRTTASLLGGAVYAGTLQLPQGSRNQLFRTAEGGVVMVVWSDRPVEETLYLGDRVKVIDAWGRVSNPRQSRDGQTIQVERMPTFVCGLNPSVAAWRSTVRFADRHVPSVFGRSHPLQLRFTNAFAQGVGGTVKVVAPDGWQVYPDRMEFKLAAGAAFERQFEVTLPFDANSGPAPVRVDFEVAAEQNRSFSVFRELDVGDGLLEVEVHTRLEDDGYLVVEQRMVNRGEQLADFKCLLYAPGRRRQRIQVFRLGGSPDSKTYRYPEGENLIGQELWLRIEEIDGPRVLNYRFAVER